MQGPLVVNLSNHKAMRRVGTLKHDNRVPCLQATSSFLFTGCADKQIRVWDAQRGETIKILATADTRARLDVLGL
jgi:WD40 repeat protein